MIKDIIEILETSELQGDKSDRIVKFSDNRKITFFCIKLYLFK